MKAINLVGKVLLYWMDCIGEFIMGMAIVAYLLSGFGVLFMIGALQNNPGIFTYILCSLNVIFWILLIIQHSINKVGNEKN